VCGRLIAAVTGAAGQEHERRREEWGAHGGKAIPGSGTREALRERRVGLGFETRGRVREEKRITALVPARTHRGGGRSRREE
jgi:hypothetical protein